MTTNAAFVTAMQGLSVTGVAAASQYNQPPNAVNTADLPVSFPMMPSGERGELITSCANDAKVRRMGFVILMEATGQSTQPVKYAALAAQMDNLETALDGLTIPGGGTLGNFIEYTIETTGDFLLGDSAFWAIVAEVTVSDAR